MKNYIKWLLNRKKIEQDLLTFCRLEYRPEEVDFAFKKALNAQKSFLLGKAI